MLELKRMDFAEMLEEFGGKAEESIDVGDGIDVLNVKVVTCVEF